MYDATNEFSNSHDYLEVFLPKKFANPDIGNSADNKLGKISTVFLVKSAYEMYSDKNQNSQRLPANKRISII